MRLHQFRVALDDDPGRLGSVGAALIDVNVLDVDRHAVSHGQRVDELLVDLVLPIDLPAVEHAVLDAGALLLTAEAADPHELRDPVTAALDAVHSICIQQHGGGHRGCGLVLVRADLAWLSQPDGGVDHDVTGVTLARPRSTRRSPEPSAARAGQAELITCCH